MTDLENTFWTSQATLYSLQDCMESHRLRFLVAYKECPVSIKLIDSSSNTAHLQKVNPELKFPFFTDKMLALHDIEAIDTYLEERFPHPPLLPTDKKIRAQLRQMRSVFRDWYLIKKTQWAQNAVNMFAQNLGHDKWICGGEFTIADIAAAPWIWRQPIQGVKFPSNVQRYINQLAGLDTFRGALTPLEWEYYDPLEAA